MVWARKLASTGLSGASTICLSTLPLVYTVLIFPSFGTVLAPAGAFNLAPGASHAGGRTAAIVWSIGRSARWCGRGLLSALPCLRTGSAKAAGTLGWLAFSAWAITVVGLSCALVLVYFCTLRGLHITPFGMVIGSTSRRLRSAVTSLPGPYLRLAEVTALPWSSCRAWASAARWSSLSPRPRRRLRSGRPRAALVLQEVAAGMLLPLLRGRERCALFLLQELQLKKVYALAA